MEKSTLEKLVSENLSSRSIANRLSTSQGNVRYWLKKFNLKTNIQKWESSGVKFCQRCSTSKPIDEFYKRRKGKEPSSYCKKCIGKQTIDRQRLFKLKCIEYKGGKCACCSFNSFPSALEFHHLDPKEKETNIAALRLTDFNQSKVKLELDKCILVCSNCHRGIHAGELVAPVRLELTTSALEVPRSSI